MTAISIEGINIFRYLFYLGVINIVSKLIWKLVPIVFTIALPITTLSLPPKVLRVADKLLKAFGYYILISLVVLLTHKAIEYNRTIGSFILYPLVAAFTIYIKLANDANKVRRSFFMVYRYDENMELVFDGFITIGSILLFITSLFVPVIAVNPLTRWFFGIIDWIYNLKVIGWLIAVGGVIYMLYIIWNGILITEFLLASLFRKIGRRRHANRSQIAEWWEEEQRQYIANRSSKVFHLPSCFRVRKIAKRNKVYFHSFQEALDSGRRPCRTCMPDR